MNQKVESGKLSKILIIDDDQTSNFITELLLTSSGLVETIETLANGKEAIDYFAGNPKVYPDLVLLDINMPLWDGFEFLDWYEANGFRGATRFAIFSTSQRDIDKERSSTFSDVVHYIEKPITQEKLRIIIDMIG